MFGWFKRWRMNRGRAIFRFWDGQRDRAADPLVVFRALLEHPEFDWEKTPLLLEIDDPKISGDALRVTADAVRKAFGVRDLLDGGLTEGECTQLLIQFTAYIGALKKSTSSPPTSPDATEPKPSERSTTKPSSDSGSTCGASKPVEATG